MVGYLFIHNVDDQRIENITRATVTGLSNIFDADATISGVKKFNKRLVSLISMDVSLQPMPA